MREFSLANERGRKRKTSARAAFAFIERESDQDSVGDSPNRPVGILRHEKRAIVCDSNANGPSPHFGVGGDKSSQKVLVFSGRRPVFQSNPDNLVAGGLGSIP